MGNKLAARIDKQNDNFFNAGRDMGIQWGIDNLQLALLEQKIPPKAIAAACRRAMELMDEQHGACDIRDPLADVYQDHIDRGLRIIWGDELVPFEQRYEMMRKIKY